jgi:hypothetical protein
MSTAAARADYYAAILSGADPVVALAALRAAVAHLPLAERVTTAARAHRIARSGLGVVA